MRFICGFPQFLQTNTGHVPQIRAQLLPSTPLKSITLIIVQFDALAPEITRSNYDHSMQCNAYHNEVPS